jgi:U6 snRNA-associated Sm-like protein LSm6
MNIALEKTAEYVNGAKRRDYGDAFVRGNNGEYDEFPGDMTGHWLTLHSYVHLSRLMSCPMNETFRLSYITFLLLIIS